MRKYSEFILVLIILIAAIAFGGFVIYRTVQNDGDFWGRNQTETEETTTTEEDDTDSGTDSTKKKTISAAYEDESVGTILIGDSRFVGMDKVVDVEEDQNRQWLVAKVGQGLSWFNNEALPSVKRIRSNNTAIETWRYVICLGVNDLGNIDGYIETYEDLTEDDSSIQLILVSVNPVGDYPGITNSDIEDFNDALQEACEENGWDYIDTYSQLMDNGYSTTDGLHYSNSTYQDIYDYILEGIAELQE